MALHLLAHNPHARPLLRVRRRKALAAFLADCDADARARAAAVDAAAADIAALSAAKERSKVLKARHEEARGALHKQQLQMRGLHGGPGPSPQQTDVPFARSSSISGTTAE